LCDNHELSTKNSQKNSAERHYAEQQNRVKEVEDELAATILELELLEMRLGHFDPIYKKFTVIFKSIANSLKSRQISPVKAFNAFDVDKNGKISNTEFSEALTNLGIHVRGDEFDSLFYFLDLDGSKEVEYKEFCRMLSRHGVSIRSKEEEVIFTLWNAIQGKYELSQVFNLMCSSKNGKLSFSEMKEKMESLGIKPPAGVMEEVFKMADVGGDGSISEYEFINLFKKYNKVSGGGSVESDTGLDWKLDLMARFEKATRESGLTLEETYEKMANADGQIVLRS
jgi:calcium-binding protein CML